MKRQLLPIIALLSMQGCAAHAIGPHYDTGAEPSSVKYQSTLYLWQAENRELFGQTTDPKYLKRENEIIAELQKRNGGRW